MEPAPQNAQTASPPKSGEDPITLDVTFTYYDYGHQYGSDHATISGAPRDLALILSRLRDDACNVHTFRDAVSGADVSRRDLELWKNVIPPEIPQS